jgi:putative protein-disulfide isomerase
MRVIYVFDALCGWCYGFSSVMNKIHGEFKSVLPFEVISGGMVLGNQVGPIGEVASYISEAYKIVEEKTGVRFGQDFLEGTMKKRKTIFDSFPPAKALKIFKEFKPEKSVEFASDLQSAIYYHGIAPSDFDYYSQLTEKYGASGKDFKILWNSTDYDVRTREEFLFASQLDVSGYPTVFFESSNKYHKLCSGYTPHLIIRDRLDHLLRLTESD